MIGWVVFRIEEFDKIKAFFARLFSFDSIDLSMIIPAFGFIGSLAVFFCFINSTALGKKLASFFFEKESYSLQQNIGLALLSAVLLFLSLSAITGSSFNPFIYFRF